MRAYRRIMLDHDTGELTGSIGQSKVLIKKQVAKLEIDVDQRVMVDSDGQYTIVRSPNPLPIRVEERDGVMGTVNVGVIGGKNAN